MHANSDLDAFGSCRDSLHVTAVLACSCRGCGEAVPWAMLRRGIKLLHEMASSETRGASITLAQVIDAGPAKERGPRDATGAISQVTTDRYRDHARH